MSYARRESVSITTSTGGAATVYLPSSTGSDLSPLTGSIINLQYVHSGSTATELSTAGDVTVTAEATGQAIYSTTEIGGASLTLAPRQPTHGLTGTQLTYGTTVATGLPSVPIVLANDRVKIVVANGGSAKVGSFRITVQ
jgi:hypothetical protein